MGMESEGRPKQPLMLKEWLELESSAEPSSDGFGCYPRHLAADLRGAGGRRRNGDVIARVSAAVRAALSRSPSGRQGQAEAASLSRTRRLRVGFWKKRTGVLVSSCSATAAASARKDCLPSPAMSPRRMSREDRQADGDGAGIGSHRRSHEIEVAGRACETTCHLDEEREQEQRLSPVSVMDFPGQDEDDVDGEEASSTFLQSLASVQRSTQQLLQRIRRFEQLAALDDMDDDATTVAEDTSCHVGELDSTNEDDGDEEVGGSLSSVQDLPVPGLPEASSPSAAAHRFRRLLQDFFRDGLSSCHDDGRDNPDVDQPLLEAAKAWLDGRHCTLRLDGKAEVQEIVERLGPWRCFREEEQAELLAADLEDGVFLSLVEELVDELY